MSDLDYIGEFVFDYRRARELSMDELSIKSGVSKSLISQIESGKVNPTVNILNKIALALDVKLGDLVDPENQPRKYIRSHIGEARPFVSKDKSFSCYVLNSKSRNKHLRIDYFEFSRKGESISKGHGRGSIEYIIVESGEFFLEFSNKIFQLKKGDIFEFKSEGRHRYIQRNSKYASGMIILFYP